MAIVPAAELRAIAKRHNSGYCLEGDPTSEWVRILAASIRPDSALVGRAESVEADDLDALADRYEKENA